MKTKKELSPKIYKTKDGRYQIHLWYKNKRYRFANGSAIEENLMPNLLEERGGHCELQVFRMLCRRRLYYSFC